MLRIYQTTAAKWIALGLSLSLVSGVKADIFSHPQQVYNGAEVTLGQFANGGLVNASYMAKLNQTQPEQAYIKQVTDGVWAIVGHHFSYKTVIEGDTGLIIYDTGDDLEEAQEVLALIRQHISDKPIHTVIYSHAHYAFGTQAFADAYQGELTVIGHPKLNHNISASLGMGADIPELAPVLTARALQQFSVFLPSEGPDAEGKSPIGKTQGFVPVNTPVSHGQAMTIDGVDMVFYTAFDSDSNDQVIVHLPESKTVLNNHLWPTYPNFYTLRGSVYRDPTVWAQGIRLMRDLQPEHLINTHTHPISGQGQIQTTLNGYYDGIMYLYDQTIRGILHGKTPQELRYSVQLPKDLADMPHNQMTYGEFSYYPKYIYQHALGWFGGDVENLNRVDPDRKAQEIVTGFGGVDAVKQAIKKALAEHDYAWGAELGGYLTRYAPSDAQAKQLLADALRQMGYRTEASIPRSWYLTRALELEGKITLPQVVYANAETVFEAADGTYVSQFRVRLDPVKSYGADQLLAIAFTDSDKTVMGLHVRSTVAEFITDVSAYSRQPDIEIRLPKRTWAQYYVGEKSLQQMLASESVTSSDNQRVEAFFQLFDQLDESQTQWHNTAQYTR